MKRKRNINFGFLPARPTRADLRKSRREFKAAVKRKTREISAEYKRLRKAAREAKPAPGIGGKQKLEQLFHEVYGQNPRQLPEFTAKQMAAIEKLLRGKTIMAKKIKSKKKKNSRKGKMPAGLRAYWAKKRRTKPKRRKPRRKWRNPRTRIRTRTVIRYRYRTRKAKARRPRRRRSNPLRKAKRITLKGFTASQIRKVASAMRRATGKRVRVVKP